MALKDHWSGPPDTNIVWSRAIRDHVGPDIDLLHDAAGSPYTLRVGRALEELNYGRFEEAISDRDLQGLQTLCAKLDGHIAQPTGPGWGAEWDRAYFAKKRVAEW